MSEHKSVLLEETIKNLNLKNDSVVVDATFGGGGHSEAILNKIGEKGTLIAIDLDEEALKRFNSKVKSQKSKSRNNIFLVNDNFRNLRNILTELKIEKVDAILADLGWSSDQLIGKGMSFQEDEELDMQISLRITDQYECTNENKNAKDIVNNYSEQELGKIIREYGEEKFWKNISKKIVDYRKNKTIETTKELAEIVKEAVPRKFWPKNINPATKTFQAIRIEINRELENLKEFIPQAIESLNPKGRLAVITFHSLEDRIVKNIFRENARGCICPPDFPKCVCGNSPKLVILTKNPVVPTDIEVKSNPRSRSAKLRVSEKI